MKPQAVRLADVFFIGPFMIYAAGKSKLSKADRATLIGLGIATILYNGINYIKQQSNETKKTT
jgi:hypothetical protein